MQPVRIARPYQLTALFSPPAKLPARTLACVVHGAPHAVGHHDPRIINVALPLLAGTGVELWQATAAVEHGWAGEIGYAHSSDALFVQLRIAASELTDDPRAASRRAYALLRDFFAARPQWHWVRVWNYIGNIHAGDGDAERYRQFNLGRADVLGQTPDFTRQLPAATAIGTAADDLLIYVLATRQAGVQIENPRQVSAFHYPRQYGPQSPSFSRARRLDWCDGHDLIVSGTASIVGHETLHAGNPTAQLNEIIHNISELQRNAGGQGWRAPAAKLFVRDPAIFTRARAALETLQTRVQHPISVLQGDVCRTDLALEAEVLFQRQTRPAPDPARAP